MTIINLYDNRIPVGTIHIHEPVAGVARVEVLMEDAELQPAFIALNRALGVIQARLEALNPPATPPLPVVKPLVEPDPDAL
jgi:hypothetical protein